MMLGSIHMHKSVMDKAYCVKVLAKLFESVVEGGWIRY